MKKFYISVFLFLISFSAFADNARFPGVIDRGISEIEILELKESSEPIAPKPEKKEVEDGREILTILKKVIFKDLTLVDEKILQEQIVSPYLNRRFRKEDLVQLKYDLTKFFYDKGYILTGVMTPPQDISDGSLEVVIYETKVGKFEIKNDGVIRKVLVNALKTVVEKGKVFHENEVEKMLADFNDLQNIKAKLELSPGTDYATTNLDLKIRETDEDTQKLTFHNYGSKLTGQHVAELHLEKGNLLNLGDKLSFDGEVSEEDMWKLGASFSTPTTIDNIYLNTRYYHAENDIGGRLADLNASGKSDVFNINLSSKVINTRKHRLNLTGGLEFRNHTSYLNGIKDTEDKIRRIYAVASYMYVKNSSLWYAALKISKGLDILGASEKGDSRITRSQGSPQSWILRPTFISHFPILNNDLMKISFSGHLSSSTLLSSDMFTLGGYGSVRGFEPAEEVGDRGYQFNIEYTYDIPVHEDWTLSAGPFLDGGKVYNRIDGTAQDEELYSAGITVEASTRKLFKDKKTIFKLDWAHTLGNYENPDIEGSTFYFRIAQEF